MIIQRYYYFPYCVCKMITNSENKVWLWYHISWYCPLYFYDGLDEKDGYWKKLCRLYKSFPLTGLIYFLSKPLNENKVIGMTKPINFVSVHIKIYSLNDTISWWRSLSTFRHECWGQNCKYSTIQYNRISVCLPGLTKAFYMIWKWL